MNINDGEEKPVINTVHKLTPMLTLMKTIYADCKICKFILILLIYLHVNCTSNNLVQNIFSPSHLKPLNSATIKMIRNDRTVKDRDISILHLF